MVVHWTRRNLHWAFKLALAPALVLALEATPMWSWLGSELRSLDFDAGRTALIQAWAAGFLVAFLAAALTARPWLSSWVATAFVCVTYLLPWAWNAGHPMAAPFAQPAQVDLPGLAHNLGVITGVAFLLAIPAAASGWLIGLGLSHIAEVGRPRRSLLASGAVVAALAAAAVLAVGVDPVLRYGPDHGIHRSAGSAPAGQVLYRNYDSRASDGPRSFAVYLPPDYAKHMERRYPVVYLLHGDPGSYRDWVNLGAPQVMDRGIDTRSLQPALLVMPDGNGAGLSASQWADSADGRNRVESSVLELVQVIDRDYRTQAGPRGRIVAGLSAGGFGAANLAARHPDTFGTAISLSGYFRAQGPVFGGDRSYLDANSPSYLVQHQPAARNVEYVLVVGSDDARYRSAADAFAAQLDRQGVAHQVIILPGSHEGAVWIHGLALSLQKVLPPTSAITSHSG
jgi:enterochelin esterase-like enzyme